MAKKQDLIDLQSQVDNLNILLQDRDDEITRLSRHNNNLISDVERLGHLNKLLAEERDRISRSNDINYEKCIALMNAIVVLGKTEQQRIADQVWHSCKPRTVQYLSEKSEDTNNYFVANKDL